MKSFDILSTETQILGKRFLEASAGTGKTFAIENLVLRLILEAGLTLDRILVVTFTRAATRELKTRIRLLLEKNGLDQVLLSFDHAQIFTIHGFCQRMLQEFAFEAGIGFNLDEWTAQEEKRAVANFFRRSFESQRFSASQLGLVLKKFRHDVEGLSEAVLKEKGASSSELHFEAAYQQFNELLSQLEPFSLAEEFEQVRPHYKGMSFPFETQIAHLEKVIAKRRATEKEFDQILRWNPCFLEKLTPENKKIKAPLFALHSGLEKLCQEAWPLIEQTACHKKTLKRLAAKWQEERERISREEEKISPDEVLSRMEKCLSNPRFIQQIQMRYDAVVIDEFQDTDPVQWKIFETLFLQANLKALYLVGDPKQSIYAFRNADIYTYMKAGKSLGPGSVACLDTNYRSVSGLIEMLNRLFCVKPWIDLPSLNEMLPVLPVKAAKEGEGFVHFFIAEGYLGRGKRWPTEELEEAYFFPFLVQEIGNLPNHDIAILVKDRYQGQRVQRFLQRWKIPSSVRRGGSLADSPALNAFQDIIIAVFDFTHVKKALLGPLIQLSVHHLTDEVVFAARKTFADFHEILIEKGFIAFYAAFLKSEWSGDSILEKLVCEEGLSVYHDLNSIADLIAKRVGRHTDLAQLLWLFKELKETEVEDRVSGRAHGIQIMTTHASKGLEFETVFALGMCCRTQSKDAEEAELRELDAEKMRQFYVALTRAKIRVYVPLAKDLSQKPVALGCASPVELFLERVNPDLSQFPHTWLNQQTFQLKEFMSPGECNLIPPSPKFPPYASEILQSFSGLSQKTTQKLSPPEGILPLGSETGVLLHQIFEKALLSPLNLTEELAGSHLEGWETQVQEILDKVFALPILDFPRDKMLQEMEFIFPTKEGMIKGFIDLCFEKEGKYYLVDWKTNWLESYSQEGLHKAMEDGDYFLQASIYATALQRYLKLYDPRPFEECFGGAYYIFVRAPAVYHFFPEVNNL